MRTAEPLSLGSFGQAPKGPKSKEAQPLAERMRPERFEDFLGQGQLGGRLQALLSAKRLPSTLLFGPPGCGKSTMALLLAKSTKLAFKRVSAPEAGIAELRKSLAGTRLLVLDEIHRFSKAQQDFFLPLLESGELTLIATTTENPSFSVTRQLLSRMNIFKLLPLSSESLFSIAKRAALAMEAQIGEEVLRALADIACGDARTLLNLVEYVGVLPGAKDDPKTVREKLPEILLRHDKGGDSHYDLASALIKSIRGSDPDAAVYYLACLLEGGEDPRFVCRRLILSASEDVGLADPSALPLAVACQQAVEFVGMPEGFIPMAETAVYLALAKKSNSTYSAYLNAKQNIQSRGVQPVPIHLRNAVSALHKQWGYGKDYKYPHSYPNSWVPQEYLPASIGSESFYRPTDNGEEPRLVQWWKRHKRLH